MTQRSSALALEIERRFLVTGEQWQRHSLWQARLRQGYLSRPGEDLTLRVRTSEPVGGGNGDRAWLTLKAPVPGPGREAWTPTPGGADAAAPPAARPRNPTGPGWRTSDPIRRHDPADSRDGRLLAGPAGANGAAPSGAPAQALSRLEFEYAIPLSDAQAMLALTQQLVIKCRHGLDLPGGSWVLDVFEGANAPLVVAEVELEHPDQPVQVPTWCSRDLTGLQQLSNAALAARPLALWSPAERQLLFAPR